MKIKSAPVNAPTYFAFIFPPVYLLLKRCDSNFEYQKKVGTYFYFTASCSKTDSTTLDKSISHLAFSYWTQGPWSEKSLLSMILVSCAKWHWRRKLIPYVARVHTFYIINNKLGCAEKLFLIKLSPKKNDET